MRLKLLALVGNNIFWSIIKYEQIDAVDADLQ